MLQFNFGGPYLVPKSFYLATSAPIPKKYMDTINVNAGGKKKLKFTVDDVNSILRYRLYCIPAFCKIIDFLTLTNMFLFKLGVF